MKLSLRAAAELLGKSQRQLRYMIQEGRLKATKDGGRWVIDRDDLPLPAEKVMRGLRDAAAVKATLESALGVTDAPEGAKRRYSVTDLRAFQANRELVAEARAKLGTDAAVARQLAEAAAMITCGCHTFHKRDKVGYLQRAREHTCYALTTLLLSEDEAAPELAAAIEGTLLPALGGTIRAAERRR